MMKNKDGDFFISDWLRNRNTIKFLGIWESMNNPAFNYGEFAIIKSKSGLNNYKISVKEWTEKTNAIGLKAMPGRYGGTYAQKDIAFEFGTWISPGFKLYLIKDYQRLKEIESNKYNLEWDIRRVIASSTYLVHTDAVKECIIPSVLPWAKAGENIRDSASITELLVLENLQVESADLIAKKLSPEDRFNKLSEMASRQIEALNGVDPTKGLKKLNGETYLGSGS